MKKISRKIKILFIIILSSIFCFSIYLILIKTKQYLKPYPIIDAHMHMYQWNKYGDPPPPNLITGKIPNARTNEEAITAYLQMMNKYNIVLGVGSGEKEMVEMWKKQESNKFLTGIEFPKFTKPVNQRMEEWIEIDSFRKLIETDQLQIMGEVTAQYAGVPLNNPKLDSYFALSEELDIPVLLHTGFGPPMSPYGGDPEFRMRYGNPLLLEDYLVKYPGLRIYIAHGGYPFIEETLALMLMYQQVYIDISAINWLLTKEEFYSYLKKLIDARLGKRIMFGSDQMIWDDAVELSIKRIKSAKFLTKEQKQDIFFNNAAAFFRLDKDQILKTGVVNLNNKVIRLIKSPLNLRPKEPGYNETVTFILKLDSVKSAALEITGFDIDALSEVVMTINDQRVELPKEIIADMQPRTVKIELKNGLLKNGKNKINFLFADAVGGTTGFSILNLKVLLRK